MEIYIGIGILGITAIAGLVYLLREDGRTDELIKQMERDVSSSDRAKKNAEDVINRTRGAGVAKLAKLRKDKR